MIFKIEKMRIYLLLTTLFFTQLFSAQNVTKKITLIFKKSNFSKNQIIETDNGNYDSDDEIYNEYIITNSPDVH